MTTGRVSRSLSGHSNGETSLVNQLQGELDLPRRTGRAADFAEAGAHESVGRQSHIDDVEQVEDLGAKLQIQPLKAARAPAERRVLDQGKVVVVIGRPAEVLRPRVPK